VSRRIVPGTFVRPSHPHASSSVFHGEIDSDNPIVHVHIGKGPVLVIAVVLASPPLPPEAMDEALILKDNRLGWVYLRALEHDPDDGLES
jgi:hypothetical protein